MAGDTFTIQEMVSKLSYEEKLELLVKLAEELKVGGPDLHVLTPQDLGNLMNGAYDNGHDSGYEAGFEDASGDSPVEEGYHTLEEIRDWAGCFSDDTDLPDVIAQDFMTFAEASYDLDEIVNHDTYKNILNLWKSIPKMDLSREDMNSLETYLDGRWENAKGGN